ncbi:hypothetical protein SAMN05660337_3000 [Maridesulfovibrio ferrireducens]|uniref:Uncharacterized protein n=1 Tax=Maridesulfovibrio ferrireducens TaxID=246191 RepID=A0A1G9KAV4_9BACT|nr:hypothetical protein [Maridesulfovibrio ferrireducens]SDL46565.1 hypothetical protein SAMN05660337_3000 [Maridesulfovibrio ferrireducens]
MKTLVLSVLILFMPSIAGGAERDYQVLWCDQNHGKTEYRLPDATRVDCLTETHAVEMDFGRKWAEAIGQSLYYASCTGKRAGVVLIMNKKKDARYLRRLNEAISYAKLPIDVWVMDTVLP